MPGGFEVGDPNVTDLTGGDDTYTGEGSGIITPWQDYGYRDPDGASHSTALMARSVTSRWKQGTRPISATLWQRYGICLHYRLQHLERDYIEDSDGSTAVLFLFCQIRHGAVLQEFRLSGRTQHALGYGRLLFKLRRRPIHRWARRGFAQAAFGPLVLGLVGGDPELGVAVTQELFPLTFGFDSPFSTTTESWRSLARWNLMSPTPSP